MITALKTAGVIFAAFVMSNWLTGGQDEILEGPPDNPESSLHYTGE